MLNLQNEAAVSFLIFNFFFFLGVHACAMLRLAAVSFPVIVPSHMTRRVAFTHATRASHPADIRDTYVSGGPNLVMGSL